MISPLPNLFAQLRDKYLLFMHLYISQTLSAIIILWNINSNKRKPCDVITLDIHCHCQVKRMFILSALKSWFKINLFNFTKGY